MQFDYSQTVNDSKELFIPMVFLIVALTTVFIFSELGQRVNNQSNEVYNEILRCDWYTYPMAVQKILPIILNGAQQAVEIKGFGNIVFSRESFTMVSQFYLENQKKKKHKFQIIIFKIFFQLFGKGYKYCAMFKQV